MDVGEIRMLYKSLKWLVRCFLCVYHRIRVSGREHIPEKGAFILVGNHVSYLDPFYVSAMLERKVHFMSACLPTKETYNQIGPCGVGQGQA